MTGRDRFRALVADLAEKAKASLPENAGRIDAAVALVLAGDVTLQPDGTATVGSATQPLTTYLVNGECLCPDAAQAPQGYCKHRLSKAILIRAERALRTVEEMNAAHTSHALDRDDENDAVVREGQNVDIETPGAPNATLPVVGASESIPELLRDHVVTIQGKPFVKVSGLLALAHARGLQSLTTIFTYNDAELALAQSTAVFPFGSFTDVGDASPSNCNPKVRLHFRRVAATRSTARALRQALNIPIVALEELMTDD
jgi:hypothetical protein